MTPWTDAHNHLQDPRLGNSGPVIAAMKEAGVTGCVVNATREEDWAAVEGLSLAEPGWVLPAFGIHPWHGHSATEGWQDRLSSLLEKHPHASVGECGLDQWVSSPSLDVQIPVFLDHIRIAGKMERPVTIHCLKAWGPLFDAFKEVSPPPRFLMHSFGGSIEVAKRLLPMGAYFSFSGYFLQSRKAAVLEVFRQIPRDRLLLETDAPDMLPPRDVISHLLPEDRNHPANLPAIGTALAAALDMASDELADLTRSNATALFGG